MKSFKVEVVIAVKAQDESQAQHLVNRMLQIMEVDLKNHEPALYHRLKRYVIVEWRRMIAKL